MIPSTNPVEIKKAKLCRHCGSELEKVETRRKPRPHQKYGFKWYLLCPGCKRMYLEEEAKYQIAEQPQEDMLF